MCSHLPLTVTAWIAGQVQGRQNPQHHSLLPKVMFAFLSVPGTAQWRSQVCRWMHCWESKHWYSSVEIPSLLMDEWLGIQALGLLSGDPRSVDGPATGNPSRQQFLLIPSSQLSLCYHLGDLPRFQINGSQLTLCFASPASHDIPGLILAANPHPQLREVSFLVGL